MVFYHINSDAFDAIINIQRTEYNLIKIKYKISCMQNTAIEDKDLLHGEINIFHMNDVKKESPIFTIPFVFKKDGENALLNHSYFTCEDDLILHFRNDDVRIESQIAIGAFVGLVKGYLYIDALKVIL